MKEENIVGNPFCDPYILKYRALIERQNVELRAELRRVKRMQLTASGRWMLQHLLALVCGIAVVAALGFALTYLLTATK